MKKHLFTLLCCLNGFLVFAQSSPEPVEPVKLSGPRVGLTYITPGALAAGLKENFNADPILTQFGWQFETRYFALPNGVAGLVEFIALVGGLEQNLFLPSLSFLIGLRNANGLEFGFGPNLSLAGAAFVLAVGTNFKSGQLNIPVNVAVVPSSDGARVSLLLGFNASTR